MKQFLLGFARVSPLTLSILTIIIGLIAYRVPISFVDLMELKTIDLRFTVRGEIEPGPEVVLAVIDEKSLKEQGKWIWPRTKMARLITRLSDADAAVIGLDVGFLEPDQNSTKGAVEEIEESIKAHGLGNEALFAELETFKIKGDHDRSLSLSIKNSKPPVVLGYFFQMSAEGLGEIEETLIEQHMANTKGSRYLFAKGKDKDAIGIDDIGLEDAFMPQSNITAIADVTERSGYFNMIPDTDGTVRWMNMIIRCRGGNYAPLSLVTLAAYEKANISITTNYAGIQDLQIRTGDDIKANIPTDEMGRLLVNFRGGPQTFPHISATDIMEGRISKDQLKDKIVLVGATAIGVYDLRVTPFSEIYPGLEIHANVVDNILRGDFLQRTSWSNLLDIFAIILVAAVMGLAVPRLSVVPGLITALGLFLGYLVFCQFLFTRGTILNMVYPMVTLIVAYISMTVYKYMTEERQKRMIRGAFSTYLAPGVVDQIVKDPDKLKLGGEEKEITAFFSDIQGFTSISEKLTATELVELLNIFLTEMTEIILDNEGTVDKYEGDAIIAFFGAPNDLPDHAERAALACIQMQEKLEELRVRFAEEGRPILHMRIGMCTGPAVVGNMGSEKRFDYTMMGDTVNIAARLEGVNKVYGTYTMISQSTYDECADTVVVRELDAVNVVGKGEPVVIYEIMGQAGEVDSHVEQLIAHYTNGLAAFRQRQWAEATSHFDKAMAFDPGDAPSLAMKKRCLAYGKTPPPPDWNGAYSMTSK